MSLVAVSMRPSLHAAAKASKTLTVSVQALYDKVRHTEPALVRSLVMGSAERLASILKPMQATSAPLLKGYAIRIVDGSHFASTDKRLKPLRGLRVGALPAQSLVIFDPERDMVLDIIPNEDAHAQERASTDALVACAHPGELWMADRNFCTRPILGGWHERGCSFIVREHGSTPHSDVLTPLRRVGRIDSGQIYEQAVMLTDQGIRLRRIELHLDAPTREGEAVIRVLINLPVSRLSAANAMHLYHRRWNIDTLFQRLESVLHSEIQSLGHPRAALLAFGVAVLAYNVLSVIQAAIRATHDLEAANLKLSSFYVATEIKASYRGMMIAVAPAVWLRYDGLSFRQTAKALLSIAVHVDPRLYRSHPRGPKKPIKRGRAVRVPGAPRSHVATARVLQAQRS